MDYKAFGDDFYPTPPDLGRELMKGIKWDEIERILESQAGHGGLALQVKSAWEAGAYRARHHGEVHIDTIEIEPRLQHILKGEGFRVVHNDFLTFETFTRYSVVLGNPPFSTGDLHLLHAIRLQRRTGGLIRYILNAETLRNPYSVTRKDLVGQLDELGAEVRYVKNAFSKAERPTDVEVAIVSIDIPQPSSDGSSLIMDELKRAAVHEAKVDQPNYLVSGNTIEALVEQYKMEAGACLVMIREWERVKPHILDYHKSPIICLTMNGSQSGYNKEVSPERVIKQLRDKYWRALFSDPEFTAVLTTDLRRNYEDQIKDLVNFEFSMFNILTLRQQFSCHVLEGIDKAILSLFEELSHKHAYYDETGKNVHYYNGWKSNKAWKIADKVVMPMFNAIEKVGYGNAIYRLSYNSNALQRLLDIEKVMCYLDGKRIEKTYTGEILKQRVEGGQIHKISTDYFEVSFYFKGTCHVKFTRPELLKKFNIYGANSRKWLPPVYGKAKYADLTPEDRTVVDAFEGEKSYKDTVDRAVFYLMSTATMVTQATQLALPAPMAA